MGRMRGCGTRVSPLFSVQYHPEASPGAARFALFVHAVYGFDEGVSAAGEFAGMNLMSQGLCRGIKPLRFGVASAVLLAAGMIALAAIL